MPAAPALDLCGDLPAYCDRAAALLAMPAPAVAVAVLAGGRDAQAIERRFPAARTTTVELAQSADPPGIDDLVRRLADQPPGEGDPNRVLVALAGCAESLPAIYYGRATGRRVTLVADLDAAEAALGGATSAILAGPAGAFDKAVLGRLLAWVHDAPDAPGSFGIFTARDLVQMADLAAKSLLALYPAADEAVADAPPPFEMIGAHGNEIHLDYRDRVLCGRSPAGLAAPGADFDCGIGCPHANRLEADRIAARTVFLISCDAFTPAGGIAPSAFSLLFRLLDGPAAAILAPYKHVQANEPLLILIEAMAQSGYSLGEIARAANTRGNRGMLADYGYLVLGDPETRPAGAGADPPLPEIVETSRGPLVRAHAAPGRAALSLTIPVSPGEAPLAVLPVSENLRAAEAFFALGASRPDSIDVTLFGEAPLPEGELAFAIVEAAQPDRDIIAYAGRRLDSLRIFEPILDQAALADAKAPLLELLRAAAAFPRPIENLLGQNRVLHLGALVDAEVARLRAALCDALLAVLAERRIWISQEYGDLFQRVSRAGPAADGACPHCANHVTAWRYEDMLSGCATRVVQICSRCGIIWDGPAETLLDIEFDTIGAFTRRDAPLTIRLSNRGDEPVRASLAVQLNAWRSSGVTGTDCRADVEIAPQETVVHHATLHLPPSFQDDILSVQLFVVGESLDLSFVSQKVTARVRAG